MLSNLLAFVVGMAVAPFVTKRFKPVLRSAVKQGIVAAHEVRKMSAEVREDLQDLAAEAEHDLEKAAQEDVVDQAADDGGTPA